MIAWVAEAALAGAVDVCIKINTDFEDALPNVGAVYDDYVNDNDTARAIRGVKIVVTDTTANPDVVHTEFADASGPTAGCGHFTLTPGNTHTIKMLSVAEVGDGHHIELHAGVGQGVYAKQWTATYQPPAGLDTKNFTQNGGQAWGILTVAAWALEHRDAGLSNEDWLLYNAGCPTGSGLCHSCDPDQDGIISADCYGGTDSDLSALFAGGATRYIIAHELGHYVLRKRNEGGGGSNSELADPEGCFYVTNGSTGDGHEYQSKEWLAEAYWEGFASFYAAVTFNDESDGDCYVHYYKDQDWDLDQDEDPSDLVFPNGQTGVNCADIPELYPDGTWPEVLDELDSAVDEFDYLDDCVNGLSHPGDLANRGTEYDMVKFWFALYMLQDWSLTDIVDVIDAADPHLWIGQDDVDPDPNNPPALPTPTIEDVLANELPLLEPDWIVFAALYGVDR